MARRSPSGRGPARQAPADPDGRPGRGAGVAAAVALVLAALVLVIYAQSRGFGFVNVDDDAYVRENPRVLAGIGRAGVVWAFAGFHASNWHPLTWLSHMLDVTLFGPAPGPMHLVNVALHLANALLLLLFLRSATGSTWRSGAAAALFAVHPLHVESVAWISERKDVLSTLLAFSALLGWLAWTRRGHVLAYAAALGCFTLSLLAKPMTVTLPFVLLLLDVWPLGRLPVDTLPHLAVALRPRVVEKLPFFALAVAASLATFLAQAGAGAESAVAHLPLSDRLGNALGSVAAYLGMTAWPLGLSSFYPHPSSRGGLDPMALGVAALVVAALSWLALRERSRRGWLLVGWLGYLGMLVPVIGLVQVGSQAMADRYTYLPLVGVFVALAWAAGELAGRGRIARAAVAVTGLAAVGALTVVAHAQAATWRDAESLHRHTLTVDEGNWKAWQGLCQAQLDGGRIEDALRSCDRAIALLPSFYDAWNSRGVAYARTGDHARALQDFQRVLELRPGHFLALRNVGAALGNLGDHAGAAAYFARALAVRPDDAGVWSLLVLARARSGDAAGAREALARLRALDPARAEAVARDIAG